MAARAPVLVVVAADPRRSGRAVEALRIAVGLATAEREVRVLLRGPAIHLLAEDVDALVDGDELARLRPSIGSLPLTIHVEAPGNPAPSVVPLSRAEAVALARDAGHVLVF